MRGPKKYILQEMARYTCGWTQSILTQSEPVTKSIFQDTYCRRDSRGNIETCRDTQLYSECADLPFCVDILVVEKRLQLLVHGLKHIAVAEPTTGSNFTMCSHGASINYPMDVMIVVRDIWMQIIDVRSIQQFQLPAFKRQLL